MQIGQTKNYQKLRSFFSLVRSNFLSLDESEEDFTSFLLITSLQMGFLRHPSYPSGMLLYIFLMLLLSLSFFEFFLCDWIIHITTRAKSALSSP